MSESPQPPPGASIAIGIEMTDAATRMTALLDVDPATQRWHLRLAAPPTPEEAVQHINVLVERVLAERNALANAAAPPVAIGIAAVGQVDTRRGIVRRLHGTALWHDFPLANQLAERWTQPAIIETTTNAAAFAEATIGAAAGYDPALYVLIGRQVTLALVADGHPVHGAHAAAGQLGHWRVAAIGPRCSCGATGHLEPIASAQAIVRNTIGKASDDEQSMARMLRLTGGRAEAMTAAQVVHMAADGDSIAAGVLSDALEGLALALANAVALLDPAIIVIDGPLTDAGDVFLAPLRSRLAAHCSSFVEPPPVVASTLYPAGAILGARLLADRGRADVSRS